MALPTEASVKKLLGKYKYKDMTTKDVMNVIAVYKDLKPVVDMHVFNDGTARELVSLNGTIPVNYRGSIYNIPVQLWLFDTHPYNPPICFVKPTSTMLIKQGKHVDANGRVYLPYLHEWKANASDLVGLIQVMLVVFGEEPPVFSRTSAGQAVAPMGPFNHGYPSYPAAGPPMGSYVPGGGTYPYQPTANTNYPPYPFSGGSAYPAPPPAQPQISQPHYGSQPVPGTSAMSRDGVISEEHIRASLVSAITDKLRWRLNEEVSRAQAELEALQRTEEELRNGQRSLQDMAGRITREIGDVDQNIDLLKKKDEEITSALEKMESQSESSNIDEAVVTTAPLYKQILNLYAEENAIEDTIFYLGEALRQGVIDLDVFLKHVRLLARKQFQLRALMQKARKTACLTDHY
ncbi:tumor susceptibility gene 101 protein-like [Petromyzon marinus]|uniref:Tumor susceptibility gene 101 protein-like n=1 Tax=Petromyzon marinus TaxID=7757 RepID=A0AAJ7WZG1_PETMA|nr:tumor susceptibility gene 101 protein-like [Petromyzon marinus]